MIADLLKPTDAEIRKVAVRETDPQFAAYFEPIAKGPIVALAILAAVGLAALPMTLFRLVARGVRNEAQ